MFCKRHTVTVAIDGGTYVKLCHPLHMKLNKRKSIKNRKVKQNFV